MNSIEWYNSRFPESQFLVDKDNKNNYKNCCIFGHQRAATSNVLICGIVRNAEKTLPYNIARIKRLGSYFSNYHVYIFENDSTDNTKDILNNINNSNFTIQTENLGAPEFDDPYGIDRRTWMARARNQYLEFARKYSQHNRINYLIIYDLDIIGGFSYEGVMNSLGYSNWDGVGSNSIIYQTTPSGVIRLHYDAWAYRELGNPSKLPDKKVNLLKWNRGENPVIVNSCFGGLMIYKPHMLWSGFDYTSDDCDHPSLNNELTNLKYRILLNPSQIVLYNRHEYTI